MHPTIGCVRVAGLREKRDAARLEDHDLPIDGAGEASVFGAGVPLHVDVTDELLRELGEAIKVERRKK